MSLVKVWTEVDETTGKCASLPAKIVATKGNVFTIRYLSSTDRHDHRTGRRIYRYEEETYDVTDSSITEYLNSDTELDFGFEELSGGDFIKFDFGFRGGGGGGGDSEDDDSDYIPSSEEEDSDDDSDDDLEDSADDDDDEEEFYEEDCDDEKNF